MGLRDTGTQGTKGKWTETLQKMPAHCPMSAAPRRHCLADEERRPDSRRLRGARNRGLAGQGTLRGEGTRRLGSPVTPLPFSARRRRAPAPPLAARQTSGPFPRGRGGLCALGPSAALAAALCLSGRLGRSFLTGQGPRAARSCLRELEERAASTVALCAPTRVSARCACLLLWREEGAPRPHYGDRRSPATLS